MANVTIKVDDDLLRRARGKAAGQGTSLSAVVEDLLEQYAGRSDAAAAIADLFALADGAGVAIGSDGITWTRDELNDRAQLR
jgi:predicted transcriptional regulator